MQHPGKREREKPFANKFTANTADGFAGWREREASILAEHEPRLRFDNKINESRHNRSEQSVPGAPRVGINKSRAHHDLDVALAEE